VTPPFRFALLTLALASAGAHAQTPWKTLVWVSTRATVVSDSNGIRQDRFFINDPEMDRIREALDLFEKSAEAESGGALDIQIDLKTDATPFYRLPSQAVDPLVSSIRTRFNEASFESDDKSFRGPYSGVMIVDPQPGSWAEGSPLRKKNPVISMRFGTPVGFLSLLPTNAGSGTAAVAEDFLALWRGEVALKSGVEGRVTDWKTVPAPGSVFWAKAQTGTPISAFKPLEPTGLGLFGEITRGETENGPAIKVIVNSGPREGQFLLQDGLGVDLGTTPLLEFWMRTTAIDPLELRLGNERVAIGWYPGATHWVEPTRDGKWQKVTVGLGAGKVDTIVLAVPDATRSQENMQYGVREFEIAGIRFIKGDTPLTSAIPADESLRIALTSGSVADCEAALSNPATSVKLAALYRLAVGPNPPTIEGFKRLVELSKNPDPMVAVYAIRAMARSQTPEAAEALKYNLEVGPFEHSRLGAAWAMGEIGTEATTPLLATMLTAREWRSRLAGIEALAKFPTRENIIIMLAMLPDPEPENRRAICQEVDLKMDLANRRLLFMAVNDPVEEVRIAAYRNLLTNGLDEFRAEAMKGVREESPYVRSEVLRAMSNKPDAAYRRYILIGLSDKDPRVRYAAIEALWQQPGDIRREELESVLQDPDEEVRKAAIALAKARGIQ